MSSSPIPPFLPNRDVENNDNITKKSGRNRELENTLGDLYVAEYQLNRLRQRLANHMEHETTFIFKHENKWYKVTSKVETFDPETDKEGMHEQVESEQQSDQQTQGFAYASSVADWEGEDVGVP